MWERESARWGRSRRIVRYDPRGLGGSPATETGYSDAEDLLQLLDHEKVERTDLVAASHSGHIALEFALRWPERVERLVLVGAGLGLLVPPAGSPAERSFEDLERRFGAIPEAYRAGRKETAVEGVLQLFAGSVPASSRAAVQRRVAHNLDEIVTDRSAAQARWVVAAELLGEISAPVLALVGSEDHPAIVGSSRALAAALPSARDEELGGADHLPNLSRPEAFDAAVEPFLGLGTPE